MKLRLNDLMKSYLMDFDLDELIDPQAIPDLGLMRAQLPEKLSDLLDLPVLKDSDGNYLINNGPNNKWVNENKRLTNYDNFLDQTGFECARNKINLWDYSPDIQTYFKDHGLWADSFLKFGLSFAILLHHKLLEVKDKQFKVIFSYGLSKLVDSVICFHLIRENEYFIPAEFEKMPFVQGVLTIDN